MELPTEFCTLAGTPPQIPDRVVGRQEAARGPSYLGTANLPEATALSGTGRVDFLAAAESRRRSLRFKWRWLDGVQVLDHP